MAQYIKTEEGYKELAKVTDNKMDKIDPVGMGSFSMNRKVGTVIGVNSHAEGNNTTASGDSSHAEGSDTTASNYYSHAEGYQTAAINNYSHAEGGNTTASGNSSHAEGTKTTASGSCSHAEGSETVANGTDSHAEGYKTTASGYSSHAEGNWATASGDYSHAEGGSTKASGNYSHTEGNGTRASGSCSHAEGGSTNQFASVVTTTNPTIDSIITAWKTKKFSVANGYYSHVEGKDNLALNDRSHAEGYLTIASGQNSHAEGYYTTASGNNSHAEGNNTKAIGTDSHVQGKFNIEDTLNTYADIIGNGTSDTARSNAATVDWSGNAWFAGDVYTGSTSGTNKDEGSKKLATEEYVDNSTADCYRDGVVMTKEHPSLSIKATAEEFSDENNPLFEISYSSSLFSGSKVNYSLHVDPTADYLYFNRNDYDTNTFQKGTGLTPAALFAGDDTPAAGHKRAFYQASGIIYRLNNQAFFNLAVDDSAKEVALETALNYKLTFKDNDSQISLTDIIDKLNAAGGTDISLGLTSAAVGQIIKVKAIDASGKPTAWEAVDIPSAVTDEHINSLIDAKLRTFQAP